MKIGQLISNEVDYTITGTELIRVRQAMDDLRIRNLNRKQQVAMAEQLERVLEDATLLSIGTRD